MTFSDSADRFNCYVDTFRSANGSLVDAMQCKLDHTWDVVRFAGRIAEGHALNRSGSTAHSTMRSRISTTVTRACGSSMRRIF